MRTNLILLTALCLCAYARAQVSGYLYALNTTGNTATLSGTTHYTYSVGEVVAWNNSCDYITGVIQPTCVCTVSPVNEVFDLLYTSKFYPNPTHSHVIVETDFSDFVQYNISSLNGKILESGAFIYAPVDLSRLAAGTYFLRLADSDNQIFKTVKIIKQ